VGTEEAKRIIGRIAEFGVRRIVFTGGDPLQRADAGELLCYAREQGLEVALSTTGDKLTEEFLAAYGSCIDLISLPLDGSSEAVSAQTKKEGHFAAIMRDLELLSRYPAIDVKVCTAVTRQNVHDVVNIARLVEAWAQGVGNRVFYNVFQTYPRSMNEVKWGELLVSDEEYAAMRREMEGRFSIRINFLTTATLDRLYVLIFPDGGLYVPSGPDYRYLGRFLDVEDLDAALASSDFDSPKHLVHARGWEKVTAQGSTNT
jgi:MoaA/NifB/PqqE/SkfB family radical SAM enzyme